MMLADVQAFVHSHQVAVVVTGLVAVEKIALRTIAERMVNRPKWARARRALMVCFLMSLGIVTSMAVQAPYLMLLGATVPPILFGIEGIRRMVEHIANDDVVVTTHRVRLAPGWTLHGLAEWVVSKRTFSTVLEPALSDMQVEFFAALSQGQPRKARWIQLRGYLTFWIAVGAQIPVSVVRVVVALWKLV